VSDDWDTRITASTSSTIYLPWQSGSRGLPGQSGSTSGRVSCCTTKKCPSSLLCSGDMSTGVLHEGWRLKIRDTTPAFPWLSSTTKQFRRDTFPETAAGRQKISSFERKGHPHHALTPQGAGLHLEWLGGEAKVSWHTLCPGELEGQGTVGRLLFASRNLQG